MGGGPKYLQCSSRLRRRLRFTASSETRVVSRMLPQPPPCIVRHHRWKFVIKTYMYKENERG